MNRTRTAIIGTGVAGLGCAHFLQHTDDLALFEQNRHVGGHSNTVTVSEAGRELPVDTGFMVFNHVTYPHLKRLFDELKVPTKRTDMSFSVRHDLDGIEYNGRDLNTLFGRRAQLLNPRYWRFLLKIDRFNKETVAALEDPSFSGMTLGEYVEHRGYGRDFLNWYIIPMGSAVWSTPPELMLKFPAVTLMRFWHNHGFLGMRTRHPWWTVDGGAREYVKRMTAPFAERIRKADPVVAVRRVTEGQEVTTESGERQIFDRVILAAHADQSLRMLADPTEMEQAHLSKFRYQPNQATLHTDDRFLPRTKLCWASWNYQVLATKDGSIRTSTHYWMNNLQGVSPTTNYFVSINAPEDIDPAKVIQVIDYEHPLFDVPAMEAQKTLPQMNEAGAEQGRFFCGSYFRYGFHEDAFGSAVNLCRQLLGKDPWS